MEIQYFGGNCVRLSTKKTNVIIDDNLESIGAKGISKAGDICLFTGAHGEVAKENKVVIDQPGEYEVSDISIQGIGAQAHMDEKGTENATIYRIILDDIRVAVIGHVYPELSSNELEALNTIDILIIPTGGNGFTLDPIGALKLIKDIEPKIIIPTHYDDKGLKYEVPQQPLTEVLKGLGMEPHQTTDKLKLKPGEVSDLTQLVVLERQ